MKKLLVCLATIVHLLPHPFGVSPVGALALYAGAFGNRATSWSMPLIPLTIAGLIGGFYDPTVMLFVYLGYALSTIAGRWFLRESRSYPRYAAGVGSGALAFFLLSNFGMWIAGYYPPTLAGLIACYVNGLPYLVQALAADAGFCFMLFGLHRLIGGRTPEPQSV